MKPNLDFLIQRSILFYCFYIGLYLLGLNDERERKMAENTKLAVIREYQSVLSGFARSAQGSRPGTITDAES